MDNVKQKVMMILQSMPEDCTWEQVRYRLYLNHQIEMSEAEIDAGRTIPHEQVMKEMEEWLASNGRNEPKNNSSPMHATLHATP